MDTRFEALRLAVAVQMGVPAEFISTPLGFHVEVAGGELLGFAIFLRRFNAVWLESTKRLKAKLLPQRVRRGKYAQVRTVAAKCGGRAKVRPSHSATARHARGVAQIKRRRAGPQKPRHKSKRSRYRSHHPFNERTGQGYLKIQDGPGRPRQVPSISKAKARERDRKKERRRKRKVYLDRLKKNLQPYHKRRSPEEKKTLDKRKKRRLASLAKARQEWRRLNNLRMMRYGRGQTRFKDERENHHPELAYHVPFPRQRALPGGKRHCHRSKIGLSKRIRRGVGLLAWQTYHAHTRRVHLRGYWSEVRRLRK